jgi:hypothetical protein
MWVDALEPRRRPNFTLLLRESHSSRHGRHRLPFDQADPESLTRSIMPLMIERSPRIPPFPSRRPAHRERKALSQDANLRRAQLPPRLRCGSIHPFSPFTPAPSPSGRAVQSRTTRPKHPTRPRSIERPPGRTHGGTLNLGARNRRPRARPTAVHSATLSRTTIHTREKAEGTAHPQGTPPPLWALSWFVLVGSVSAKTRLTDTLAR